MLRVERPTSLPAFLGLAGAFLEAREAEHNLILALVGILQANPELLPAAPQLAVVLDEGGAVVGAALRTPPQQILLSVLTAPEAAAVLAEAFAGEVLPGVQALPGDAAAFADRWTSLGPGRSAEIRMHERVLRLERVIAPRAAPGRARLAVAADRDLLGSWLGAFSLEALRQPNPDAPMFATRWINRVGGRAMWLWEVDDPTATGPRVVSLAGVSGPTPNGIRVAPVYTPPADRGRGYAGNLVAAASQAQLDAGRRSVFLFTDLANPTANHVYESIGYEPVVDVDQWAFTDAAASRPE